MRNIHGGRKEEPEKQIKGDCETDNHNITEVAKETETKHDWKAPLAMLNICTECGNRFASKDNLRRHMRKIHVGRKNDKEKQVKGKAEPDNDNNTDMAKDTDGIDSFSAFGQPDKPKSFGTADKPMDIIKELEEFPLLEADDMEEIFEEFGLTTAQMFEQVFREEESYFEISQHAFQNIDVSQN